MIKIYYNPACSKCRNARSFFDEKGVEYEIYEYLEKGLSIEELRKILDLGNLDAKEIARINDEEYREFSEGKDLSEDEVLGLISKNPRLLQRPIIVGEDFAIVARDEDSLNKVKTLVRDD
ncbi:MAG: ArsC/Spx/MgsR family protein [Candidatus Pacearchaeota archaeon]